MFVICTFGLLKKCCIATFCLALGACKEIVFKVGL